MAIESASRFRNSWVCFVDPVEILEDHHQRLIERLAQDDAFDRFAACGAS